MSIRWSVLRNIAAHGTDVGNFERAAMDYEGSGAKTSLPCVAEERVSPTDGELDITTRYITIPSILG
jgi:hypothetical protein